MLLIDLLNDKEFNQEFSFSNNIFFNRRINEIINFIRNRPTKKANIKIKNDKNNKGAIQKIRNSWGYEIEDAIQNDFFVFVEYRRKYFLIIFSLRYENNSIRIFKASFDENGNNVQYKKRNTVKNLNFVNTKSIVKCDKGLKNSCQIWAFAKILDLTFEEAHEILSKEGWKPDNTYYMETRWENALKKLGKQFIPIYNFRLNGSKFSLINAIAKLNTFTNTKNRSFVIITRNHALCIVDNVIYDNRTTPPYTRVETVYEIK